MNEIDISFITVSDIIYNTVDVGNGFSYSLDYVVLTKIEPSNSFTVCGYNDVLEDYVRNILHKNVQINCYYTHKKPNGVYLFLFYRSQFNENDELYLFKRIITGELRPSEDIVNVCKFISYTKPESQIYYNLYDHDVSEGVIQEKLLYPPVKQRYHSNVVTFIIVGYKNIKQIKSFPRFFENEIEIKKVTYFDCEFYVVLEVDYLLCCYCPYESRVDLVESTEQEYMVRH